MRYKTEAEEKRLVEFRTALGKLREQPFNEDVVQQAFFAYRRLGVHGRDIHEEEYRKAILDSLREVERALGKERAFEERQAIYELRGAVTKNPENYSLSSVGHDRLIKLRRIKL
ncbi:hypothetical protein HZA33_02590 [Candidatus Pacearchaeota archaeon]|nr:hypothetical protein [Candidatus Pacearchaeota archaeon]